MRRTILFLAAFLSPLFASGAGFIDRVTTNALGLQRMSTAPAAPAAGYVSGFVLDADGKLYIKNSSNVAKACTYSGDIVDADVSSGAALAWNKMASLTTSRVACTDGSGVVVACTMPSAYLDASSSIQSQLDGKASTTLSNLGTTAINADLLCATSGSCALGSAAKPFGASFLGVLKDGSSVNSIGTASRYLYNTSGDVVFNWNGTYPSVSGITLAGPTSGSLTILPYPALATTRTITTPSLPCASGQYWADDGSGNYSCTTPVGTVSSVGLEDDELTGIFEISGSPVTGSGTITIGITAQDARKFLASGSVPSVPNFRAISAADLPVASATDAGIVSLSSQVLGDGDKQFSDNVGIGTSPSVPLDISAPNATANVRITDSTNGARLRMAAGSINFDLYNSGGAGLLMTNGSSQPVLIYTNATERLRVADGAVTSAVPVLAPNGSASAPSISFTNSSTTGFYRDTADRISIALNGAYRGRIQRNEAAGTGIYGTLLSLASASGGMSYLTTDTNEGAVGLNAGTGPSNAGGQVWTYGNSHATKANTIELSTNNGTNRVTITSSAITAALPLNVTGEIRGNPVGTSSGDGGRMALRELAANGTNIVGFRAPDTLSADSLYQLPSADGSSGQVLQTNGSKVLSWATPPGGSTTAPSRQAFTSTGTTVGYVFTVTSANATAGATYTNNGNTYTVAGTIAGGTVLFTTQTSAPEASGTLTKASGTGDSTITFSRAQAIATYTTPTSPAPLYIRIRMAGGGGGGTGQSTTGANGTMSVFGTNMLVAGGGQGGGSHGGPQTPGGTAVVSGVTNYFALPGGNGEGGEHTSSGYSKGGNGGSTPFLGGAGQGASQYAGENGVSNTGGGGSGASILNNYSAPGGGSGAFIEATIGSPASTYYYAIGAGGTGGTGGATGGNGAAGVLIVDEFYQ